MTEICIDEDKYADLYTKYNNYEICYNGEIIWSYKLAHKCNLNIKDFVTNEFIVLQCEIELLTRWYDGKIGPIGSLTKNTHLRLIKIQKN